MLSHLPEVTQLELDPRSVGLLRLYPCFPFEHGSLNTLFNNLHVVIVYSVEVAELQNSQV